MMTVWKFPLKIADVQKVSMPVGAQLLFVAEQLGQLCLWARVDEFAPKEDRVVAVVGTGHPAPDDGQHVGSVILLGGSLVFHVFVQASPSPEG